METVSNNVEVHLECHITIINTARELYAKVDLPSVKYFKIMIQENILSNFPIIEDNIEHAEHIYIPIIFKFKVFDHQKQTRTVENRLCTSTIITTVIQP